jgi:Fur family peroxide stress response transcriptional regulator
MTKTQRAILDVVTKSGRHLSAQDIYWAVKREFPSIALGTIYRNLQQFAEAKLIRRLARGSEPDHFEGNMSPHDHAFCIRCGNILDLEIPGLKDYLQENMDCGIVSFDLSVNYVCRECAEKEAGILDGEDAYAAEREKKTDKAD